MEVGKTAQVVVSPVYANAIEQQKEKRENFKKAMEERDFQMPNEDRFAHSKVNATKEMKKMSLAESFFTEWVDDEEESTLKSEDKYFEEMLQVVNMYYHNQDCKYAIDGIIEAADIMGIDLKPVIIMMGERMEGLGENLDDSQRYPIEKPEAKDSAYVSAEDKQPKLHIDAKDSTFVSAEDKDPASHMAEMKESVAEEEVAKLEEGSYQKNEGGVYFAKQKRGPLADVIQLTLTDGEWGYVKSPDGTITPSLLPHLSLDNARDIGVSWSTADDKCYIVVTLRPNSIVTKEQVIEVANRFHKPYVIKNGTNGKVQVLIEIDEETDFIGNYEGDDFDPNVEGIIGRGTGKRGRPMIKASSHSDDDDNDEIDEELGSSQETPAVVEDFLMEETEEMEENIQISAKGVEHFVPTGAAEEVMEKIKAAGKEETLNFMLEDMYPQGINAEELNKMLSENSEWVYNMLGITSKDEE